MVYLHTIIKCDCILYADTKLWYMYVENAVQDMGGSAPQRGRYGRRDRSSNRPARVVGSNPGLRKRRLVVLLASFKLSCLNYLSSFRAIHHSIGFSHSRI